MIKRFLLFVAVIAAAGTASAQTDGVVAVNEIPASISGYWDLAIAAVSPWIVWMVAQIVPRIPKVLLPSITPLVGIGLGLALNKFADTGLAWADMAKAGALAVFVREVFNQAVTKRLNTESD